MEEKEGMQESPSFTTSYFRNITIFTKNLCLLKYSNKENGMLSFGFVLLPLMLILIQNM